MVAKNIAESQKTFATLICMAWPGRHFQPDSKSEYLDVLFAGTGYEHQLFTGKKISNGMCAWVIQPLIDNRPRLQCTVS